MSHFPAIDGAPAGPGIVGAQRKAVALAEDEKDTPGTAARDPISALLLAVAESRDRSAFAELFRHFAPRLKTYVMAGGCDAAAAEEIVQETMLAVWRRAETFDSSKSAAATWVFTIARNKRIDALRRARRVESVAEPEGPEIDPDPTPAERLEALRLYRRIAEVLSELPDDQAIVLRLAYLEEKSHAVIARELGIPIGTVKSRIRLALDKMRTRMT